MSTIDHIPNVEFLGDALPFVGRIREIIEVIQLFEDFEPDELEGLARYMRCYRAPLGTDEMGRDLWSRIVMGAQISLQVGFASVALGSGVGGLLGITSAWYGGRVDQLMQRLLDALMSIPTLILALAMQGKLVDQDPNDPPASELLKEIAAKEQISLEQVIAVGDGANDLPMISLAGLGIAFNAKPVVRQTAKQSISTLGLDGILYLIGVRDRDVS